MKSARKLRSEAARLAVDSFCSEDVPTAQHLFAMAIMWENYLSLGADETQALMKLLPEDKAQILKLVPRAD